MCREVAFRAFGTEEVYAAAMTEAQRTALAARLEELQTVWRANGTPTAVVSVEGRPVEFSFVPLHQYGDTCSLVPYESCSALLEGYYAAKDKAERLRQRSKDLAKTVKNLYERAQRKLAARRAEQQESSPERPPARVGRVADGKPVGAAQGRQSCCRDELLYGRDREYPAGCAPFTHGKRAEIF